MLEKLKLDERVAVVTGGSRGLGREMALALADAGADVCIAARNREQLDATAAFIAEKTGRRPLAISTDVQSSADCDRLIRSAVDHFGGVDIMVNNAGIGDSRGAGNPIWDLADEDWVDGMEVNLYGTFYCSRAAVRHFRAAGKPGVILNVSSGMGVRGAPGTLAYAAAKAGVISLTQSLAVQLARDNIRVNCIVPGFLAQTPPEDDDRARHLARGRFIPARRIGEAWEMGPLAVLLCSDASAYMTGESIALDGGGLAGGIAPTGFSPAEGAVRG